MNTLTIVWIIGVVFFLILFGLMHPDSVVTEYFEGIFGCYEKTVLIVLGSAILLIIAALTLTAILL